MRTTAMLTVLGVCAIAAASPAAAQIPPTVRVIDTSPFTVRGSHFRPFERVTVTVHTKVTATKTAWATRIGSFLVVFRTVETGSCPSYSITAIGNHGSRTSVKLRGVDCAPLGPIS